MSLSVLGSCELAASADDMQCYFCRGSLGSPEPFQNY